MRHGARSVLKWNLVLDENHGPQNGGCKDCRGVLTWETKTRTLTKNEEFFAFGHVGRFVPRGSHVIESSEVPGLPSVAFLRPDGRKVAVCCADKETAFALKDGSRNAKVTVPAGATATLLWS